MCTVSKLRNSVPKGAYFTSIDISDAFHHFPIHMRFQKYLAFTHEGKLFFFQAMPFGINIGPRIFSLIASGAVKYLHNIGISASVSIDDWLLWNEFAESPYTSHVNHSQPPSEVGLHPQPKKSLLEPSPTITYLGISWSGSVHTLLPSSKALEKVRTMALEILQLPSLPWKKYQRLLGSINFVAPYIEYGPLHLRQIILTSPNYKVKKSQPPSQPFPQHLRWWTRTQNLEAPIPMSIPPPNLTVWTRRLENRVGGGIFSGIHGQRRLVPRREPPPHKHPGMSSRDTISPLTETSTGVSSPGKDGQHCSGVPYQQTRVKQKRDLVSLPARASNTVHTEQIDNPIKAPTRPPQHMGRLPLSESPSENGVSLSPQSFQQLRTLLSPVIDLFVHPGNAKLPAFGCPFPFPSATVVDALATNWYRWKMIYLFPPSTPDSSLPPKTARLQRLRAGHRPSASFRSLVARVPSRLHPTRRRPRHRAMGARRIVVSYLKFFLLLLLNKLSFSDTTVIEGGRERKHGWDLSLLFWETRYNS